MVGVHLSGLLTLYCCIVAPLIINPCKSETNYTILKVSCNDVVCEHSALRSGDKIEIVDRVNEFRNKVAGGLIERYPYCVGNIRQMVWNEKLAEKAQHIVNECPLKKSYINSKYLKLKLEQEVPSPFTVDFDEENIVTKNDNTKLDVVTLTEISAMNWDDPIDSYRKAKESVLEYISNGQMNDFWRVPSKKKKSWNTLFRRSECTEIGCGYLLRIEKNNRYFPLKSYLTCIYSTYNMTLPDVYKFPCNGCRLHKADKAETSDANWTTVVEHDVALKLKPNSRTTSHRNLCLVNTYLNYGNISDDTNVISCVTVLKKDQILQRGIDEKSNSDRTENKFTLATKYDNKMELEQSNTITEQLANGLQFAQQNPVHPSSQKAENNTSPGINTISTATSLNADFEKRKQNYSELNLNAVYSKPFSYNSIHQRSSYPHVYPASTTLVSTRTNIYVTEEDTRIHSKRQINSSDTRVKHLNGDRNEITNTTSDLTESTISSSHVTNNSDSKMTSSNENINTSAISSSIYSGYSDSVHRPQPLKLSISVPQPHDSLSKILLHTLNKENWLNRQKHKLNDSFFNTNFKQNTEYPKYTVKTNELSNRSKNNLTNNFLPLDTLIGEEKSHEKRQPKSGDMTTASLKYHETTCVREHDVTTASLKYHETTCVREHDVTTASLKYHETTCVREHDVTTASLKYHETTCVREHDVTTASLKYHETTCVREHDVTTASLQFHETTCVREHITTSPKQTKITKSKKSTIYKDKTTSAQQIGPQLVDIKTTPSCAPETNTKTIDRQNTTTCTTSHQDSAPFASIPCTPTTTCATTHTFLTKETHPTTTRATAKTTCPIQTLFPTLSGQTLTPHPHMTQRPSMHIGPQLVDAKNTPSCAPETNTKTIDRQNTTTCTTTHPDSASFATTTCTPITTCATNHTFLTKETHLTTTCATTKTTCPIQTLFPTLSGQTLSPCHHMTQRPSMISETQPQRPILTYLPAFKYSNCTPLSCITYSPPFTCPTVICPNTCNCSKFTPCPCITHPPTSANATQTPAPTKNRTYSYQTFTPSPPTTTCSCRTIPYSFTHKCPTFTCPCINYINVSTSPTPRPTITDQITSRCPTFTPCPSVIYPKTLKTITTSLITTSTTIGNSITCPTQQPCPTIIFEATTRLTIVLNKLKASSDSKISKNASNPAAIFATRQMKSHKNYNTLEIHDGNKTQSHGDANYTVNLFVKLILNKF